MAADPRVGRWSSWWLVATGPPSSRPTSTWRFITNAIRRFRVAYARLPFQAVFAAWVLAAGVLAAGGTRAEEATDRRDGSVISQRSAVMAADVWLTVERSRYKTGAEAVLDGAVPIRYPG